LTGISAAFDGYESNTAGGTIIAPKACMIHVAVTRTVREGCEKEFEQRLSAFFGAAEKEGGTNGAFFIRRLTTGNPREYGILRAFEDTSAKERFYDSALYREWNEAVRPLVEDEPVRRELHGLEAFFRRGAATPPAWKMALLTWLAVNVAVFVFSQAVPRLLSGLSPVGEMLLVNAFVVVSLTWVLMPVATRLAARWLDSK
jgi:antibiotic biosynthesis monooxygenase (ABM) superfamily enzyme